MEESYLIGVDVGSAEVRCGVVDGTGRILVVETQKIDIHNPRPGFYQQSSEQIWNAVVSLIKKVTNGLDVTKVKGIGCDATCSLVIIGKDNQQVTVSPNGEEEQNVIMWMDHRAGKEAEEINRQPHPLLQYLGGRVSLEMQMPKLKWLKNNMRDSFDRAVLFFDLPDFLTWKFTGKDIRSQCSLVCKWMYEGSPEADNPGWNESYLKSIDLSELCQNHFSRIGSKVSMPGERVGGLSKEIAKELGLLEGTHVASSLIDAHAGTLGLIATNFQLPQLASIPLSNRLGMICGTSSCFMLLSEKGVKVDGVWGPYYGAVLEDLWLSEGGQSAAGQLLDHVVSIHPAKPSTDPAKVATRLHYTLRIIASKTGCSLQCLTQDLHVYPDFRGNRSPLADPSLRGMMSGLDLSKDVEYLAILYLATIQALAYSARQTVEKLEKEGLGSVRSIILCGGLTKNKLFVETLAGVMSRYVAIPKTSEAVILGSAMLAASAASLYPSLTACAKAMASIGDVIECTDPDVLRYHSRKYQVYLKMQADQKTYKDIMTNK